MKRLLYAAAAGVAILVLAAAGLVWHVDRFLDTPVNVPPGGMDFEIEPGTSFHEISRRLGEAGIVSRPRLLRGYARWSGQAGKVQAGEFHIAEDTTAAELLNQFTSGNVRLYSFTIIEGWNRWDLLAALRDHAEVKATMTDEDWPTLLEELGAEMTNPEGLFLPDDAAHAAMQSRWSRAKRGARACRPLYCLEGLRPLSTSVKAL